MFLDEILEDKRREVAVRQEHRPLSQLEHCANRAPLIRDFMAAIRQPALGVIAEIKRASPSRGPMRPDLDAPALARQYELGGSVAVSVLTDGPHFGARGDDLEEVRSAISLPVLRKEFIIGEYQIWESRAMGADAVLLIVAALEQSLLARLIRLSGDLGMTPLVEVHTAHEVRAALGAGATLLGINNRDLYTFRVDLETTKRLRPAIPEDVAVVSESGILGPAEAASVWNWGADAVLVGEALVTSACPEEMVRTLRTANGIALIN